MSESYKSGFSLSNFPSPPPLDNLLVTTPQGGEKSRSESEYVLDDGVVLVPPRMPAAAGVGGARQTSFPFTDRGSGDSALVTNFGRLGSSGFDVTSFIGGLSGPSTLSLRPGQEIDLGGGIESEPDTPVSAQATIIDLRDVERKPSITRARTRIIEPSPLSAGTDQKQLPTQAASSVSGVVPVLAPQRVINAKGAAMPVPPRNMARPSNANAKLNAISGPIQRVEAPLAYDKPRSPPTAPKGPSDTIVQGLGRAL